MAAGINKTELVATLGSKLPQDVSLPVVYAIIDEVDPILGVASAKYEKYAELSGRGLRTVVRTIPALHRHGLLRKQARHDGPPVLWLPELMDMQVDEALRRAAWLARNKNDDPQNYFTDRNGKVAAGTDAHHANERAGNEIEAEGELKRTNTPSPSRDTDQQLEPYRQERRVSSKSSAYENDREILRLVYNEWDARGLTPDNPKALSIAIHALGYSRPERFKHLDGRGLRKAFQRARARLPVAYDRWIGLIQKWDKSYDQSRARNLVDRLVAAVGDRPREILDEMFDRLEQRLDYPPKKVRELERWCVRLKENKYYRPQFRPLKRDNLNHQVYAELGDGPKTREELSRRCCLSHHALKSVGQQLRRAGQIKTVCVGGQSMWARADMAHLFPSVRDAIVQALKEQAMTIPTLVQKTGMKIGSIKSALHLDLVPNGEVIRTKYGVYALPDMAPKYVSKKDAIMAALENGDMARQALASAVGSTPSLLQQFIDSLLADEKIIRTKRGHYALPGAAPVYVSTSDAIISALTKKAMKIEPLLRHVNKLTRNTNSRSMIYRVLLRLKKRGWVKQDRWGGEYRLVRRK
jgi:hypothetical protein